MRTRFFFIIQNFSARVFFVFVVSVLSLCSAQTIIVAIDDAVLIDDTVLLRQPTQTIYTEQQLQNLISPSVVRIIQHVEGRAQIAPVIVNIKDRTISLDKTSDPIIFEDLNENIIGTGFIVSPDGHILTNAHFVSDLTSKLAIITPYIKIAVQEAEDAISESIEDDIAFSLEILDFVLENSTFELTKEIIVIDPQGQISEINEDSVFDITQTGLSASILYVNDNFYKGAENLAIIKIKGKDLPAIFIPNKNISTTGDKFYAFDTLSVYNFKNINNFNNAGDIYDLKIKESSVAMDRPDTDILYTDLELYQQASGGPSFNALGETIGILVFEGQKSEFADAPVRMLIIPNNIIQRTLNKVGVANEAGVYAVHFKKGIEYINSKHCDEASKEFETALSSRSTFTKNITLNSYLIECYETFRLSQESSENIPGLLNTVQEKIASLDLLDWVIIVLSAILILTLLISFIVMIGKVHKKKEEPYKPSKNDRSEEMQKARRAPLSETLPKQAKEVSARPVGNDVAVLPADKISFHLESQKNISKQETSLKVKTDNKTTLETLQTIPKEDRKQLAELWPKKYDVNGSKNSINAKKTERLTKDDNLSVNKTTEKETVVASSNVDPMLAKYIQETRALGFNDEEIGRELKNAGWKPEDINVAFDETK